MLFKNMRAKIFTVVTTMALTGGMLFSPVSAIAAPEDDDSITASSATGYVEESSNDDRVFNSFAAASSSTPKFKDVSTKNIFYKEIQQIASYKVSTGWEDKTYRPLAPVNRDAMIVFIYRAMGSPDYTEPKKSPFTDVSTDNMFYKEIAWAHSTGISTGWKMKDGTRQFRPLEPVKRDAMAAFLMRASGDKAPKVKQSFRDVRTSQEHAAAITWMKNEKISTGWKDNTYRPLNNTNRDAMAAFLIRWLDHGPSATSARHATVKEQRDWTRSLPRVCQNIEMKSFQNINTYKNYASFRATVTYRADGSMYYSLFIDGTISPNHSAAVALMKHECGHVMAGIYSNEKGWHSLDLLLDKGWARSDNMRFEKIADCIADELGAKREANGYTVGYGTVCSSAQKNVAKTLSNYSRYR